jgi:hypothetical protein
MVGSGPVLVEAPTTPAAAIVEVTGTVAPEATMAEPEATMVVVAGTLAVALTPTTPAAVTASLVSTVAPAERPTTPATVMASLTGTAAPVAGLLPEAFPAVVTVAVMGALAPLETPTTPAAEIVAVMGALAPLETPTTPAAEIVAVRGALASVETPAAPPTLMAAARASSAPVSTPTAPAVTPVAVTGAVAPLAAPTAPAVVMVSATGALASVERAPPVAARKVTTPASHACEARVALNVSATALPRMPSNVERPDFWPVRVSSAKVSVVEEVRVVENVGDVARALPLWEAKPTQKVLAVVVALAPEFGAVLVPVAVFFWSMKVAVSWPDTSMTVQQGVTVDAENVGVIVSEPPVPTFLQYQTSNIWLPLASDNPDHLV